MKDELVQGDGISNKHGIARHLAELAVQAQAAGDDDRAEMLFAEAEKTDPEAVAAFLADRAADPNDTATSADAEPQDDEEIAAMTRTVQPGSAAPSRAGITGPGSGADGERG
jgi:lipopolysaccharide biosynthesis regulator YciM